MAKPGRPKIELDTQQLESILAYGFNLRQCAAFFRCSEVSLLSFIKRTYKIAFGELKARCEAPLLITVRQNMIKLAKNPNHKDHYKALVYCDEKFGADLKRLNITINDTPYTIPISMQVDDDDEEDK